MGGLTLAGLTGDFRWRRGVWRASKDSRIWIDESWGQAFWAQGLEEPRLGCLQCSLHQGMTVGRGLGLSGSRGKGPGLKKEGHRGVRSPAGTFNGFMSRD